MFKKAVITSSKLRCAIFGVSGSGKTFSSLRIAKGLRGKVAVIDTEHGSAAKYADRFEFDIASLFKPDIEHYIEAINNASGYDVLIIDSLSHGWAELLEHVDMIAKTKYKGNSWSAWSAGTPLQKKLVNALLSFDGHIIATMRTKTEWVTEQSSNGKSSPRRVGTAPEQGKNIEYEFDILIEINQEHIASVLKDRSGKFQDRIIEKPGEDLGEELAAWLSIGVKPEVITNNNDNKNNNDISDKELLANLYAMMSEASSIEELAAHFKNAKKMLIDEGKLKLSNDLVMMKDELKRNFIVTEDVPY